MCVGKQSVTFTFSSVHSALVEHLRPLNPLHVSAAFSVSINSTLTSYVVLAKPPNFSRLQVLQLSPDLEDTHSPCSRHTMNISSFLFTSSYPDVCRGRQAGLELPALNFV